MSLRSALTDVALPSAARTASGNSGPFTNAGAATAVFVGVHVTAASGTTPTLNVSLEESNDGTSWSAVPGSGAAQLTAAGNALAFGAMSKQYVRVAYAIGGTGPSFTFHVSVVVVEN